MNILYIFNKDNPICLYCNSKCHESGSGDSFEIKDFYNCQNCKETFIIISSMGNEILVFEFTCNDIIIRLNDTMINSYNNFFSIKKENSSYILVPEFTINFSDKEKLYNKLQTYLIFS